MRNEKKPNCVYDWFLPLFDTFSKVCTASLNKYTTHQGYSSELHCNDQQ